MRHRTVAAGVFVVASLIAGAVIYRTTTPDTTAGTSIPNPPTPVPVVAPAVAGDEVGEAPDSTVVQGDGSVPLVGSGVEVPIDPSGARTHATAEGARQSAIDFVSTVRQRLPYITESSARSVLEAWIAPGAAPTLVGSELAQAAGIRDVLGAGGGDMWWLVTPLAARIDALDGERARVSVWLAAIAASGTNTAVSTMGVQPMVRFQTDTVELVWADGAWRVWSITSIDGPTPMTAPSATIATVDIFVAHLDGFAPLWSHR